MLFEVYTCKVNLISGGDPSIVERVEGTHLAGRGDADVIGFTIALNLAGTYPFPQNLGNIFRNLKAIEWIRYNLREVIPEDLRPWPNLAVLSFRNNLLTSLEGDLFQHSLQLEFLRLDDNEITNVGHGLLDGLSKLSWLSIRNNPCINVEARTPQQIQEVINQLRENCPPLAPPTSPPTIPTTLPSTEQTSASWLAMLAKSLRCLSLLQYTFTICRSL